MLPAPADPTLPVGVKAPCPNCGEYAFGVIHKFEKHIDDEISLPNKASVLDALKMVDRVMEKVNVS